ncbi:MAG: sensor histidine kinase [Candidatus Limisoma sp.]
MNKTVRIDKKSILGLLTHIMVISIIFILPEVIFTNSFDDPHRPAPLGVYIHTAVYIIIFYYNYFYLIDRLLFRKRVLLYVVSALAFVVLMVAGAEFFSILTRPEIDESMRGPVPGNIGLVTRNFAISLLSTGLSLALKFSVRWAKIEQMNDKIISEQKDMELTNLKSQLNPHFLFNTLNNIYALIQIDSTKAQNAVHQLSKMLRYALYEDSPEVELSKDLDFVHNFIELMKLRLSANHQLTVDLPRQVSPDLKIAPLLFISLIENAFKYGMASSKPSVIKIAITVTGTTVSCHTENSYFPEKVADKRSSGIGLSNLKRRLSLVYNNQYNFTYGISGNMFISDLSINLNPQNN